MDNTATGIINGVGERQLYRKSDNQPFTMYDVESTIGRLTTTKKELADEAKTLVGTPVLIGYSEKENNGFVNKYLNKLTLAATQPLPGTTESTTPIYQATQAAPSYSNAPIGRDEAIWRQTATKVAAGFNNKDLAEYWGRVRMLMEFYRTGDYPVAEGPNQGEQPGPGAFVPPQPGDFAVDGTVTDDDIPFIYSIY